MKRLVITAIAAASLLVGPNAQAHVLIVDESRSQGALLHINPDDNPIAGEEALLYFDTQSNLLTRSSTVTLTIRHSAEKTDTVPTTIEGSLVTASYTFPVQGVYTMSYNITDQNHTSTFLHTQRVSRGATVSALDKPHYTWAEAATVSAVIGIFVVTILAISRRRDIAKQSRF